MPEFLMLEGRIRALTKLKRDSHRNKALGKALHKPGLLLAVIQKIEVGKIIDNLMYITADLIATFQKLWTRPVPEKLNSRAELSSVDVRFANCDYLS